MSTLRDAMSHAALGWVKPELDETLRQVRNEVEYYAEDPSDPSRMRFCAGYLHQVQGTLRMVELYAPAMVAEELEQLANAIGAGEVPDRDEACATLMRGSVLLPDYLERLQNGHRDIPIVLMPLLNDIRAARAAPGINESVLFAFAPESASATEAEVDHARGSLSGRNRELLDTVGNAVKEELLRIKDALDLHLRTGGEPVQLQTQVNELGAVADTLGMMGLGVARGVVVQQRDALRTVVDGSQQIDESLLLDIAGALLYVDASLDDQVAHLGASGSGDDDPAAAENRRTVEVLAHEAIANFTAAREHFVAFIETNWSHAQLQEVPRLLGEVAGALRMLELVTAADYLQGVRQYIEVELVGRQRVPSGRQLDTLADAMASLEYYLEALRERRPGREDILDITRASLESLRYWPLPDANAASADVSAEALPVAPEAIELTPWDAPHADPVEIPVVSNAPAAGSLPPMFPDFTFEPAPPVQAEAPAPLVFAASTAASPEAAQWTLSDAVIEDDAPALGFASFDPVIAEDSSATRWSTQPPMHVALDALESMELADIARDSQADAALPVDAVAALDATVATDAPVAFNAAGFDPVAAEQDGHAGDVAPIDFTVDSGLHNADDVLSLPVDDDDAPAPAEAPVPVITHSSTGVHAAVIGAIEMDDASARFLADLDEAAARFSTEPPAPAVPMALPDSADAFADVTVGEEAAVSIAAGFEDDGENIDQDIREVFIEEFDEELVNLGNLLPIWRADPSNLDRLRAIRRVFHTLKGSGRLVGARTLGEFSWKVEGMLNRVLDGSRAATPAVVALVTQAFEVLPQLNAALRDGSRVTADLQAMQAIADRVAGGEETFHVPLQRAVPAATVPVEPAAAPEDAPAPVTEAPVVPVAEEGTPADIDDVLREILEAEVETHLATLHAWLQDASVTPRTVTDSLLRAVHTMNGAFAMTDVPEITAVTGGAESFIKRLLAADATPDADGVDALAAAAAAISTTMLALQAESPRVPVQAALAARLQALADTLPEARWPALAVEDDDQDDIDVQAEAEADAEAEAETDTDTDLAATPVQHDPAGELTGAHDLSAYLDADLHADATAAPQGDGGDAGQAHVAAEDAAGAMPAPPVADQADEPAGLETVELTAAEDLSRYFDPAFVAAEPVATHGGDDVADMQDVAAPEARVEAPAEDALEALEDHHAALDANGTADAGDAEVLVDAAPDADNRVEDADAVPVVDAALENSDTVEADAAAPVLDTVADTLEAVEDNDAALDGDATAEADTAAVLMDPAPGADNRVEDADAAPVVDAALESSDTVEADPAAPVLDTAADTLEAVEDNDAALDAGATAEADDVAVLADSAPDADNRVEDADAVPVVDAALESSDTVETDAAAPVLDTAADALETVEDDDAAAFDEPDQETLDTLLPHAPAFGEPVDEQQALDDGLTVIDASDAEGAADGVLGLDATHDEQDARDEADAFAFVEPVTEPAPEPAAPAPYFELEDAAPAVAPVTDVADAGTFTPPPHEEHEAHAAAADVHADDAAAATSAAAADALDFNVLDQELVDIFVEEGKDLLDHCDGVISDLRAAPNDREAVASLQRDLHTLKGGARMAGINAIGDLGHGIESLLEAVAANRTDIDRSDVQLLERGFDRLHQMLTLTGQHRSVAMPDDLIGAFEQRTLGRAVPAAPDTAVAEAPTPAPAPVDTGLAAAPLSAPVPVAAEAGADEDSLARPQQEQVRVRADLLDRLVNHAGEVAIYRSRLEQQLGAFRGAMGELDRTNARLRDQLRRLDLETEAQIVARYQREQEQVDHSFDPLELDRFSTLQQLSRALNESAADLGGLQGVLDDLSRQYDVLLQQQSRVSSELQDGLMRARMVPFDGLVPRLRRVVRQAGQDTGKQVHVVLEGTHGELDRNVLDRMVAPLEHMLRNSVAHGLETPDRRRAAGKPEEGRIAIRLRREGSEIVLEVADDGAGLDRAAIRRRGEQRGLVAAGAELGDAELDAMIFAPGFSTADQVSQLAGRGVGMDVVYNEVRQLGGSVDIHSVPGEGVTFTLRLPQTLAVTQAVFVQIGDTTFAVPVASVSGIGRIARERFENANGGYHYGGEEFALYDLGTLVGQGQARAEGQAQVPLLLVRAGELRAAVAIDQVLGNREIVVKPVGLQIASVPGIYGATITGDGRVVVILDVAPLVRRFQANPHKPIAATAQVSDRQVPLVMVVDDSLTMRKVTGRILERHNFEVTVARDGIEAMERLEERVPDLMLLDIEMPRMDGYELATVMRSDPRWQGVPIVMITSRSGDKHRQRAFELGVQRYLGKPYQELDLMRNVYDLLGIARARQ